MQFLEKLWKMLENIEILNLSEQKEEETKFYQNQIVMLQIFSKKIVIKKPPKNRETYEQICLFRPFNTRIE